MQAHGRRRAGRTLLAERGVADRLEVITGDMFTDTLPGRFNVHRYSQVLPDWDLARVEHLLRASFDSLAPGGRLLDHDTHINATETGPRPVAESSDQLPTSSGATQLRLCRPKVRSPVARLCVPEKHPLALARPVRLADLHGHHLLTWGPPGTPFTDRMLNRLAVAGARVEPVDTRVRGVALAELVSANAVAILPVGWPAAEGITQVEINEEVTLPLTLLWAAGTPRRQSRCLRADLSAEPRRRPA